MALGMLRYEIKDYKNSETLEQKIGQKINLEGIIVDEPDERENYTRLTLETNGDKILLYTHHYPEFHYGDKIRTAGLLKKPQNAKDSFDWVSYLAKDDIYYEMIYPKTEFISGGNGSRLKEKLFILKEKFVGSLNKVIPEPHSAFMAGLTIGAKKSMPQDLQDEFKKTGIIHVVVLSGYNITLVANTIMKFFSFLPRIFGIGLGAVGIILFTIMTGASATAVRASIMALLVILARATGRIYTITWALFLTGFFMIFQNPKILRFDASFQLSFLATLALIYLAPYFKEKFRFLPEKFNFREIISSTAATQIFVLPLLLYKMGIFPLVSLPVNFLVLIFVPATMFFGFITGGLGMIWNVLSIPFGWISYGFLQYELWVVKIFAKLPFSSFTLQNFPFWLTLFIYAIYVIIIYKIHEKDKKSI
jgi:competence protein ComEC